MPEDFTEKEAVIIRLNQELQAARQAFEAARHDFDQACALHPRREIAEQDFSKAASRYHNAERLYWHALDLFSREVLHSSEMDGAGHERKTKP